MQAETISIAPKNAPKRISILGATGSVGCSTVDLVRQNPKAYDVVALTAMNNVENLVEMALELKPDFVAIGNDVHYAELKQKLDGSGIEVAAGEESVIEAATRTADWTMAAIVGAAGLKPTLKAIEQGRQIAFASKECLVCAGDLMMQACKQSGATLLPVDSEHNAIFQVFDFEQADQVEKIVLTASGGPFSEFSAQQMEGVTPKMAVNHPNWDMGAKISVDSATVMNKGLELIEAYHLFPLSAEQIEIVVHPESIIHSMVHYRDGSVLAQMGMPDMRIPIAYTLGWPKRLDVKTPALDLLELQKLSFFAPDETKFPCLKLAKEALKSGQWATTIVESETDHCRVYQV